MGISIVWKTFPLFFLGAFVCNLPVKAVFALSLAEEV